jgi:thiamine biosynthesis lipoprotein
LDGEKWKIGINRPQASAAYNAVYKVLTLHDQAMATSGDYRNFFEANGKRYSHVMNPRTGYPVSNGVVSVSITAPNCTLADGLATAIMVMGPEKGIALIDTLDRVEGLVIVQVDDGSLHDHFSRGFESVKP